MLAWWAAIPFVAACAIYISRAYPVAREAQGADLAFGSMAGTLFGLLLVALLFAWIAFRLSGRSQLVSTIVFSVFALGFSYQLSKDQVLRRNFRTDVQPSSQHFTRTSSIPVQPSIVSGYDVIRREGVGRQDANCRASRSEA
jgi:hypothetical protein